MALRTLLTLLMAITAALAVRADKATSTNEHGLDGCGKHGCLKGYYPKAGPYLPIAWDAYKQNTYYQPIVPPIYVRRIPAPDGSTPIVYPDRKGYGKGFGKGYGNGYARGPYGNGGKY